MLSDIPLFCMTFYVREDKTNVSVNEVFRKIYGLTSDINCHM
jgi:hypothetical protein